MLKALFKTYTAPSTYDRSDSPQDVRCDLQGEWVPVRHDEWYNSLPGKHSKRARASHTKMIYDSSGKGKGWVGEVYVDVTARTIAPGRYSAKFSVHTSAKTLPWSATDGHLSVLEDGTLQVQYPSYGIKEYWKRVDGRGVEILRMARSRDHCRDSQNGWKCPEGRDSRELRLVFRHFGSSVGASKGGICWHWGLSVGGSIYEVHGGMAVIGPTGLVAASSAMAESKRTSLSGFHGYLDLPAETTKRDEEIEEFSRTWVRNHPVYKPLGPNCHTYTEDLFTFLTGEDLPFSKAGERMAGQGVNSKRGPEHDQYATWLDPSKRP